MVMASCGDESKTCIRKKFVLKLSIDGCLVPGKYRFQIAALVKTVKPFHKGLHTIERNYIHLHILTLASVVGKLIKCSKSNYAVVKNRSGSFPDIRYPEIIPGVEPKTAVRKLVACAE